MLRKRPASCGPIGASRHGNARPDGLVGVGWISIEYPPFDGCKSLVTFFFGPWAGRNIATSKISGRGRNGLDCRGSVQFLVDTSDRRTPASYISLVLPISVKKRHSPSIPGYEGSFLVTFERSHASRSEMRNFQSLPIRYPGTSPFRAILCKVFELILRKLAASLLSTTGSRVAAPPNLTASESVGGGDCLSVSWSNDE